MFRYLYNHVLSICVMYNAIHMFVEFGISHMKNCEIKEV